MFCLHSWALLSRTLWEPLSTQVWQISPDILDHYYRKCCNSILKTSWPFDGTTTKIQVPLNSQITPHCDIEDLHYHQTNTSWSTDPLAFFTFKMPGYFNPLNQSHPGLCKFHSPCTFSSCLLAFYRTMWDSMTLCSEKVLLLDTMNTMMANRIITPTGIKISGLQYYQRNFYR